jgi:hypothetical protein
VAAAIPAPGTAAKALASRRESVTIAEGGAASKEKEKVKEAHALKEFAEDGRHFSLVR